MTRWNIDTILTLLQECGEIALSFYENPGISVKDDKSLVTRADHAIETLLGKSFDRPEEGSYMIGEETVATKTPEYLTEAFRRTTWIVDPIDGTAPYAHHLSHWGISIGFMQEGRLTESAIFLPVTREYFLTDNGTVYYANPAHGKKPVLEPLEIRKMPAGDKSMIAITQGMARKGTLSLKNPLQALGCAVVPLTYLIHGRFLAYIGSLKLWDIAGCIPILRDAGFILRFKDGREIDDRVTAETYVLPPDTEKRWKMRGTFIAAPSEEVLTFIESRLD